MIGGRGRDRTGDPLLAKQVLSQLSYTPTAADELILGQFAQFCMRILHENRQIE
jgi:hypothetical protein